MNFSVRWQIMQRSIPYPVRMAAVVIREVSMLAVLVLAFQQALAARNALDGIRPTCRAQTMMPQYIVRHLADEREELCCFQELEDESAAMYFNIIQRKVRRKFTTERIGERRADYVLVARLDQS